MKKTIVMSLVLSMAFGFAFAADKPATEGGLQIPAELRAQMEQSKKEAQDKITQSREEMKAKAAKAREEAKAKLKERRKQDAQLKDLAERYKSAKAGSKLQAAIKEEMNLILIQRRQEQLAEQEAMLKELNERLKRAEKELEAQKHEGVSRHWTEEATQRLVASNGNVRAVFGEQTILDKALEPYIRNQERMFRMQKYFPAPNGPQGHTKGAPAKK